MFENELVINGMRYKFNESQLLGYMLTGTCVHIIP
jgi:hypothetical protein